MSHFAVQQLLAHIVNQLYCNKKKLKKKTLNTSTISLKKKRVSVSEGAVGVLQEHRHRKNQLDLKASVRKLRPER